MNILITGMSGLIGGAVRQRLASHAEEAVGFVPQDAAEDHR